ncbi:MAG: DUF2935 domain-containing protein [Actinobacteria bacterium]|nr:MAG: DUF2935 domain-containing protein [Actinomycetota bacterium]
MNEITFKESKKGRIIYYNEGLRPLYSPSIETESTEIIAQAYAIFWADQTWEHAWLLEKLLPIDDLAKEHEEAKQFKEALRGYYAQLRDLDIEANTFTNISEKLITEIGGFIDFENDLKNRQLKGKICTLIYPLFLEHTVREQNRSLNQLQALKENKLVFDRQEIITFWSQAIAEHAAFFAHWLDPTESQIEEKTLHYNQQFLKSYQELNIEIDIDTLIGDFINYSSVTLNNIIEHKIRSIIFPDLADHYRREAIFFRDQLRKAEWLEKKAA